MTQELIKVADGIYTITGFNKVEPDESFIPMTRIRTRQHLIFDSGKGDGANPWLVILAALRHITGL
jgi:hypothetical protein